MSTESLTSKQENFCQLIALHHYSQYDAYRESYNVSEFTKRNYVDNQASLLISENQKIAQRIEALKQSVTDAVVNKTALTR